MTSSLVLFRRALADRRRWLLGWSVGIVLLVVLTLALFWGGLATLYFLVDHWMLRGVLGTVWAFSLGPVLQRLHLFPKLDVRR